MGHHSLRLSANDLQVFGSVQSIIPSASNQRTLDKLPQLHQMTQIDGLSRSAALNGRGHSRTGILWIVSRMWQNPDSVQFSKLCLGLLGDVSLGVVLLKQSALPTDQSWVLLFELLVDAVQLLTIKLGVDGATTWNQLKMQDSFKVQPNASHHFFCQSDLFWMCRRTSWQKWFCL